MKRLFFILALAAGAAHADDMWVPVTVSNDKTYSVDFKRHSCAKGTNTHDVHYQSCLARSILQGVMSFGLASVDVTECVQGFGTLWELDLNGEVQNKFQVAAGGGSNAANEFDFLCALAGTST